MHFTLNVSMFMVSSLQDGAKMATRFQVLKFHRTSLVGTLGFAGLKRSDCFKFRPGNVNSPSCLETESCRPSERSEDLVAWGWCGLGIQVSNDLHRIEWHDFFES